jgi:predicted lipoprotein with Yx(FWY)xxD motif
LLARWGLSAQWEEETIMFRTVAGALMLAAMTTLAFAAAAEPAKIADSSAGKIWVDPNGMTLYTFDKDKKGEKTSACKGDCIKEWPPLVAPAGAKASGDWTLVAVVDASGKSEKMWAYDGQPLYLFADDKKTGDVTGDGKDDFHVAKASE